MRFGALGVIVAIAAVFRRFRAELAYNHLLISIIGIAVALAPKHSIRPNGTLTMRRCILFATDFSFHDRRVFDIACRMALLLPAKLLVVHVREPLSQTESELTKTELKAEFARYFPANMAIEFEHLSPEGDPGDEILKIVDEHEVAMVVLETHGRKGIERIFKGSVAEKTIRRANCPVMTILDSHLVRRPESVVHRILVPIDFSVYGYAALEFASLIASSIDAEITFVHVDDTQKDHENVRLSETENRLWQQLKKFKPKNPTIKYKHKLFMGDPGREISDYANQEFFDFVILGTHGRTGLRRTLMGSVAERVVRNTNCPVITVKPDNKRRPVASVTSEHAGTGE